MVKRLINLMLLVIAFSCSALPIALGEAGVPDYVQDPSAYSLLLKAPHIVLQLVPVMLALMLAFRGLSEALLIVARKTQNQTDDKVAQAMAMAASMMAQVLAYVGVGMPKDILMQKAEAIALKDAQAAGAIKPDEAKDGPKK